VSLSTLQARLKERLLQSLHKADSIDRVNQLAGAIRHFRENEKLTFSQYQELIGASEVAKLRIAPGSSAAAKGGAA